MPARPIASAWASQVTMPPIRSQTLPSDPDGNRPCIEDKNGATTANSAGHCLLRVTCRPGHHRLTASATAAKRSTTSATGRDQNIVLMGVHTNYCISPPLWYPQQLKLARTWSWPATTDSLYDPRTAARQPRGWRSSLSISSAGVPVDIERGLDDGRTSSDGPDDRNFMQKRK